MKPETKELLETLELLKWAKSDDFNLATAEDELNKRGITAKFNKN